MSLLTIENDLRTRVRRLHPDVVVIYPAPASYLDEELPRPVSSERDVSPPVPWYWALYPRVIARVRGQVKQVLPDVVKTAMRRLQSERSRNAHPAGWQFDGIPEDRLQRFGSDLARVVAAAREIGARPIVVTHANSFVGRASVDEDALQAWQKFYPRARGETIIAFDSAARDLSLRVALEAGADTMDARSVMARMPTTAFADFVHFTDLGSSAMAKALSGAVCRSVRAR
jgi:hypothetical protein